MKILSSCLVGCVSILCLASCGGGAAKDESASDSDFAEAPAPKIFLEGMYATSSKLPLSQYALDNVFDGRPETYWSTATGAASDEGIMLYFPGTTTVKEIKLTAATGSDLASVKTVSIYGDGHKIATAAISSSIAVNEDLSSLFIKIEETDHSEVIKFSEDESLSIERFDDKFSVGFSEIEILDNNGKLQVVPPVAVAGAVVASSVLSPADAYAASQLFDARKEFVWAEGGKGSGENEYLRFNLDKEQTISSIKIWNGYQRSEKHFNANARIKAFEFASKDGIKGRYELQDTMEPQVVSLTQPLTGKEFVLTVLEVYPGKDYKDLVVSELLFFNETTPFVLRNYEAEDAMKSLLTKTKGSVLEKYIDKRLHNQSTDDMSFESEKSLILRSNKTFVIYEYSTSATASVEQTTETVADGNWEIIDQKENSATIRIFGKLFNLSEAAEVYKGNTSSEVIKIFQDNLHITPEEVKGEKFIDAFVNRP
ncbi:MAG TPA: hypothetical protein VFE50_26210 [Cyclobacteriaceae bacterium]|nr:hypothetical protein [Cyclobacteriaceae bacterium]